MQLCNRIHSARVEARMKTINTIDQDKNKLDTKCL